MAHPNAIRVAGILLTVGGAIVFVIAFLGCCGAVKEWRPLLVLYAIALMIILAIEIAAAIYAGVNRTGLEDELKTAMQKSLNRFYNGTDEKPSKFKAAWDVLTNTLECCGVMNEKGEFNETGWFNTKNKDKSGADVVFFPGACCPANPDGTYLDSCMEVANGRFDKGCYDKFHDFVDSKLIIVIGVAAAVAVIQIFGIIFAFCLCSAVGDENYA